MITSSRQQAGVTLIELIVVMAMMISLLTAIGYAFSAGLDMQSVHAARRAQQDDTRKLEERLTKLLQGAKLPDDATNRSSCFIGQAESYGDTGTLGCDRLTFTTLASDTPSSALYSDDDFETQHKAYGPTGGLAEVSLGMKAVGDAGSRTGLFERLQRPADGDHTQGGRERVLSADVARIGFRFWDGLEWVDTWDTTTNQKRLPSQVKVSYILTTDSSQTVRTFVVFIPASDIDADHPLSGGTS